MAKSETEKKIDEILDKYLPLSAKQKDGTLLESEQKEYESLKKEYHELVDRSVEEDELWEEIALITNAHIDEGVVSTENDLYYETLAKRLGTEHADFVRSRSGKQYLKLWYNDTFGWGTAYAMSILSTFNTREEFAKSLLEYVSKPEVRKVFDAFGKIERPQRNEKGAYQEESLNNFFHLNCIVGAAIAKKLNEYSGFRIDNFLLREKPSAKEMDFLGLTYGDIEGHYQTATE